MFDHFKLLAIINFSPHSTIVFCRRQIGSRSPLLVSNFKLPFFDKNQRTSSVSTDLQWRRPWIVWKITKRTVVAQGTMYCMAWNGDKGYSLSKSKSSTMLSCSVFSVWLPSIELSFGFYRLCRIAIGVTYGPESLSLYRSYR